MIYLQQFPFIQVVLNAAINKTTKMHIFNEKALKEIGRLYSWIGSSRWQQLQAPQAGKRRDAKGESDMVSVSLFQGFMKHKIIASHTCFGEHMDVNC